MKINLLVCAVLTCGCSSSTTKKPTETGVQTKSAVQTGPVTVVMKTTKGDIEVELYDQTPKHRDNFVKLVNDGYYDGVLFHRVIKDFMIQAGDPDSKKAAAGSRLGSGGPGYTVPAEFVPELFHKRGALSAARLGDQVNPQKASSGSQFYIVVGKVYSDAELDQYEQQRSAMTGQPYKMSPERREAYKTVGGTPHLDDNYTVFGHVTKGLDVVERISLLTTDRADRPVENVRITKMTVK